MMAPKPNSNKSEPIFQCIDKLNPEPIQSRLSDTMTQRELTTICTAMT